MHQAPQVPQQAQQQPMQVYNPEPEVTRNLMVNYIPTTVDELQLRQLFERFGPIESVKIVCDRESRQSRGYGFVKYQGAASAQQAINELNGFNILNKRLKVALAASGNQRQRSYNASNSTSSAPNNGNNSNANYYGNNFGSYPAAAAYPMGPNPYGAQQNLMALQQQYMLQQQAQQQQAQAQAAQSQQIPPQQMQMQN